MAGMPVTEVEAQLARRRWIAAPVVLVLLIALLAGLAALGTGIATLVRYSGESTPFIANEEENFKYGSIGTERHSGLPYLIWQALPRLFPEEFAGADPAAPYSRFGFLYEPDPETGRPRDLPIGIARRRVRGIDMVWFNCAVCHAGTVSPDPAGPRRIIAGMPSNNLDLYGFTSFLLGTASSSRLSPDRLLAAIEPDLAKLGWVERLIWRYRVIPTVREELLKRSERLLPLLAMQPAWGPGRVDTFNPYKVLQFEMTARDIPLAERVGTADFPSIFNQRPRGQRRMQLHWDGNNRSLDERNISAAVGAGLVLQDAREADLRAIERVADWLLDLSPPASPMLAAAAPDVIERGRRHFMRLCAGCHGWQDGRSYVFDPADPAAPPERRLGNVAPIGLIGTDPARLDSYTAQVAESQRRVLGLQQFTKTNGYANQPLDGLWLRAPYLHNGSVPTLADLLRPPAERPRTFLRGGDLVDRTRGGFVAEPGCSTSAQASPGRFCYDTSLTGNHNTGHEYGTGPELSDTERAELLAYLLTF
jgi:mono/diheme cytochrome c family protein